MYFIDFIIILTIENEGNSLTTEKNNRYTAIYDKWNHILPTELSTGNPAAARKISLPSRDEGAVYYAIRMDKAMVVVWI